MIKHLDRKRMINVTADVDEKVTSPLKVSAAVNQYFKKELRKTYPNIVMSFGGEQEETAESLQDFRDALFLALF